MVRAFPLARLSGLMAILIAAGCAEVPPSPPQRACAPAACAECPQCPAPAGPAETGYQQSPFTAIPGWQAAAMAPGVRAFAAGCSWIAASHPLRRACDAALAVPANDENAARRFVETTFSAWSVIPASGGAEGTITGYYEPILQGSRTRSDRYRYPVYGVPEDLVAVELESVNPELKGLRLRGRIEGSRVLPYWTRAQIEGMDAFRAPVLAWVEDPVELLFLQIQGSGWVEFAAGGRVHLGYADQNGHPYRSIGRILVERREMTLDQASMQGIKAWAAANPRKLREVLDFNPSYVFFRELPAVETGGAPDGPIGALGAPLTAGYSLAVDARTVPLGAPVFLATTMPLSQQPLQRLMAAQDTGGAIRGAGRADFYWGTGNEAGMLAGRMRQQGRMWILWPRDEALPRP
ncbi:MAG TPA: MltA domain-containing protein [Burkholderiales bacterium]|nr:MltA domain-containing protein [Burkholderiales bacterium]